MTTVESYLFCYTALLGQSYNINKYLIYNKQINVKVKRDISPSNHIIIKYWTYLSLGGPQSKMCMENIFSTNLAV
uniref:Uncharacterized protein n=1 Tax=Pararge aegeria TaxID=116150 RepID=S4NHF2_9NEOP